MKTIYLMRHGETLFNVMDVNQGQCDSPLTENGVRQAQPEGFLGNCGIVELTYSEGRFEVRQIVTP